MKNNRARTPAIVFTDADNTLWDTNRLFARAQLSLLKDVEVATERKSPLSDRLAFVRQIDQLIAQAHHANLKYPPKLLAEGLALALLGKSSARTVRLALSGTSSSVRDAIDVNGLAQKFLQTLQSIPELRPGVKDGLVRLNRYEATIIVVTEGNKAKCHDYLTRHSLDHLISHILEGQKRPELYERARTWAKVAGPAFMIGDQLDRDILPAQKVGLRTVYYPSEFQPVWTPEVSTVAPDVVVADYAEAANWIVAELGLEADKTAVPN